VIANNFMRMEARCVKSPKDMACVAEEFPDEDIACFENLFAWQETAQCGLVVPVRNPRDDLLHG
jgi:hypothetical protein